MNSPKFYFDVYKRFVNLPEIANMSLLEVNTTGIISSQMWKQLFGTINVENDVTKLSQYPFDFCYLNLDDFSNVGNIVKAMNLEKRPHGIQYFLMSSKIKFWAHINQLISEESFQLDGRRFYSSADLGFSSYKIKSPDQTIIRECSDSEATLFEYR